jgi:hypothetical protein
MPAVPPIDQDEFDFLLPYQRPLLRMDEVQVVLRVGKDVVYALEEAGQIEGHQDGPNCMHKITRRSLLAHLARTANYRPADFTAVVRKLAASLTRAERATLIKQLQSLN